jgi:ABC-2 type transport system ATP-binding protein
MRDLLASFRDEGMTVFVSSHLLAEVQHVADHLIMISRGRMAFQGPVEALVRSHPPRILVATADPADRDLVADIAAALDWESVPDGDSGLAVSLGLDTTDAEAGARAAELNGRAHAAGVTLARLEVRRPTLEEAFFELTGTTTGDIR